MRRLAATLLLGLVSIPATAAVAHGTFVDARPLPGVEVGGVVDEVALLFPEQLVPGAGSITVLAPTGDFTPSDSVEYPVETVIRLPIVALARPGTYHVAFTVPAADGFVFEGSFEFDYSPDARPLDPLPYGRVTRSPWLVAVAVLAVLAVVAVVAVVRSLRSHGSPD